MRIEWDSADPQREIQPVEQASPQMVTLRGGLRLRITVLVTCLSAVVGIGLLWLTWRLVGDSAAAAPRLPPGTIVRVDDIDVDAAVLADYVRDQAQHKVLLAGSIALCCLIAATAVLAWMLTSRVLGPLREITATARRLSVNSLGERLGNLGGKGELAALATTFDAMLDRLQAAFQDQQNFVANASHELRTPLTVIRTELDVTLDDDAADTAELRRMAAVVRDAAERAERSVGSLLLLARTGNAGIVVVETVDLMQVVRQAWEIADPAARQRKLRTRSRLSTALTRGDPALLDRIVGNLIENAICIMLTAVGWK